MPGSVRWWTVTVVSLAEAAISFSRRARPKSRMQKKVRPFPPELVRTLPPLPPECERGYVDGVAIVYDRKTRIILDSIDLISAIAGH